MTIQFTSKKVGELLKEENLRIPSYQRPYKWNRKHIRNLFYDLRDAMGKRNIRLVPLSCMKSCMKRKNT